MEIVTDHLVLRRFRESDAVALHAIFSDAEAMRYWSTPPHASLAQTRDFIARTIVACEAGTGDDFAVTHAARWWVGPGCGRAMSSASSSPAMSGAGESREKR